MAFSTFHVICMYNELVRPYFYLIKKKNRETSIEAELTALKR